MISEVPHENHPPLRKGKNKDSLKELISDQLKNEEVIKAEPIINKYTPLNSSESTKSIPESQKSNENQKILPENLTEIIKAIPEKKVLAEKRKSIFPLFS